MNFLTLPQSPGPPPSQELQCNNFEMKFLNFLLKKIGRFWKKWKKKLCEWAQILWGFTNLCNKHLLKISASYLSLEKPKYLPRSAKIPQTVAKLIWSFTWMDLKSNLKLCEDQFECLCLLLKYFFESLSLLTKIFWIIYKLFWWS